MWIEIAGILYKWNYTCVQS